MKKILTIAAAAALLLTGCQKNEMVPAGEQTASGAGEINFTTYTGRAVTKAGTDLNQSFNVEAFNAGGALFFPSTKYTWSASAFTGDTPRYWPYEGNLDFYAVSPTTYTDTQSASKDLKPGADKKITVTKTDGTADILAADTTNVAKVDPVALKFGHKLTKVAFKAVGADTNKTYKIDSIIVAANSTSTYTFGASESWATSSDAFNYIFLGTDTEIPAKTKSAISVGATRYLIPNQSSVKAKVRYSIYEGPARIDTTTTPIEVTLPTTAWGINKSIIYSLTLNFTSSAKPVTFSATETGWDTEVKDTVEVTDIVVYNVSTSAQLDEAFTYISQNDGKYVVNLAAGSYSPTVSPGSEARPFTGKIVGQGNSTIITSNQDTGAFPEVGLLGICGEGAEVSGIKFENVTITGVDRRGLICSAAQGAMNISNVTIKDCKVTANNSSALLVGLCNTVPTIDGIDIENSSFNWTSGEVIEEKGITIGSSWYVPVDTDLFVTDPGEQTLYTLMATGNLKYNFGGTLYTVKTYNPADTSCFIVQ